MCQNLAMFNDFLITDINENIDFCDEVLAAIKCSSTKADNFCGNVYELNIGTNQAILTNLHDNKINSSSIELKKLQTMLIAWREKITTQPL